MRHEATPPVRLSGIVRGTVAQQQVRAGVAQATAEQADAGIEAALPPVYANDGAAATGGIDVGQVYRLGDGTFQVRSV